MNTRSSEHKEDEDFQEYCACTTFEQMVEANERGIRRLEEAFGEESPEAEKP